MMLFARFSDVPGIVCASGVRTIVKLRSMNIAASKNNNTFSFGGFGSIG